MARRKVFVLGGKVGHVTRHVQQLFKVKRSKIKVTHKIYAVKGFSIGPLESKRPLIVVVAQ